jgi:hypothetical protein
MAKAAYADKNGKEPPKGKLTNLRERKIEREGTAGRADYATATPAWIVAAIVAVTAAGGAIQFGYSRDGGVYTVVILLEGEIEKNYVKQSEGIDQFCEELYTAFTGVV